MCYNPENEETSELAHPGTPMATRASTVTAEQLFDMPDDENAKLDASDVIPGWRFPVGELFK